ncbi:ComEA family DNA-binding protein [Pseudomonas extremorientalis]
MQNAYLCALVFTVLTSFSLSGTAAPEPSLNVDSPNQSAAQVDIAAHNAKVNLNAADAQTLRLNLFGIGAAKAKAIVAYRESNGPFTAVDELLEVKGIGKALMEKNRDRLEIK